MKDLRDNTHDVLVFLTICVVAGALILMVGCGVHDKELAADGAFGGACFANGTCDSGLICSDDFCVGPPDARTGLHGGPDATIDASTYPCDPVDDVYEPNGTFETAYHVLPGSGIEHAAVCPATDVDYYLIQLSVQETFVARLVYDDPSHGGVALQLKLYGADHVLINSGALTGLDTLSVSIANAAAGMYYARVDSGGVGEDNYSFFVSGTP